MDRVQMDQSIRERVREGMQKSRQEATKLSQFDNDFSSFVKPHANNPPDGASLRYSSGSLWTDTASNASTATSISSTSAGNWPPSPSVSSSRLPASTPAVLLRLPPNHNAFWCDKCDDIHGKDACRPPSGRYLCPEPGCCKAFWDVSAFNRHHCALHGCNKGPHSDEEVTYLGSQKRWACGFCAELLFSHSSYKEHVQSHLRAGDGRRRPWDHSLVILGLLQQELIRDAWIDLTSDVAPQSQFRPFAQAGQNERSTEDESGVYARFLWDELSTARSSEGWTYAYGWAGQLQDFLEYFCGGEKDASFLARRAFSLSHGPFWVSTSQRREGRADGETLATACKRAIDSVWSEELLEYYRSKVLPLLPRKATAEELGRAVLVDEEPVLGYFSDVKIVSCETQRRRTEFSAKSVIEPDGKALSLALLDPTEEATESGHESTPSNPPQAGSIYEETESVPEFLIADSESAHLSDDDYESDDLPGTSPAYALASYEDEYDDDMIDENGALPWDALDAAVEGLVERVMDEFWTRWTPEWDDVPFREEPSGRGSSRAGQSDDNTTVAYHSSRPLDINTSGRTAGKRRRGGSDSDGEGCSEDEEEDRSPRRPGGTPASRLPLSPGRKLACPFRKHDPATYSLATHRVCAASSWDSVHRVKEHLYRSHRPIYCPRCKSVFKDKRARDVHLNVPAERICAVQNERLPPGMTDEQETQLRSKKRISKTQTEEDKWRHIYGLLFPNEPIPSPYFEPIEQNDRVSPGSHAFHECEGYVRRHVPRLVRDTLLEMARQDMQPVEERLLSSLQRIIPDCVQAAFSQYREMQHEMLRNPSAERAESGSSFLVGGDEGTSLSLSLSPRETEMDLVGMADEATTLVSGMPPPSIEFLDGVYAMAPPLLGDEALALSFAEFVVPSGVGRAGTDSAYGSGQTCCVCGGEPCVCYIGMDEPFMDRRMS